MESLELMPKRDEEKKKREWKYVSQNEQMKHIYRSREEEVTSHKQSKDSKESNDKINLLKLMKMKN